MPPAEGGGMEISMKHMKFIKTAGIIVLIFVVIVILLSIVILALTHNFHISTVKTGGLV